MSDPDAGLDEHEHEHHHVGEPIEDLEELTQVAELEGMAGLRAAEKLVGEELRAKSPLRRAVEFGVSIAITVVIFARLIPTSFGVEYGSVWAKLADVDHLMLLAMFAFWFFTMWCYAGVLAASLPGLSRGQAVVVNFSGSALANVVPFGGAVGIGGTFVQTLSWGFGAPSITLSIIVSGIWNVFAKLGMPILVITALAIVGESSQGLAAAAFIGFGILVATVVVFMLLFRSERLAQRLGTIAEGAVSGARKLVRKGPATGLAEKVLEFRHRTMGLVRDRWRSITLWMVAYKLSQGLLQLMCARAVGIDTGWLQILAVYTFGELLTTIPATPSGVGFVEAGSAGLLVSFGAPNDAALAAVLLYRAFTYLFEIPLGAVGWITWATKHSWRRPPGSREPAPIPN